MWDTMCLPGAFYRLQQCDAAGAHTLDENFSVHQGAASKDSSDIVHESPLQKYITGCIPMYIYT